MLLLQTDALCAHLQAASSRLPDELWAAVAKHIQVQASDEDKPEEAEAAHIIPHKVLVSVGKWARAQRGEDRGE